jgi:hypothetical protein
VVAALRNAFNVQTTGGIQYEIEALEIADEEGSGDLPGEEFCPDGQKFG